MNIDDIIRMAREAFAVEFIVDNDVPRLERFASLVAAAEREACIEILEAHLITGVRLERYDALKRLRDEIRERGNVK